MSVVITNERIAIAYAQALQHHNGNALAARRMVAAALEIASTRHATLTPATQSQEISHERR